MVGAAAAFHRWPGWSPVIGIGVTAGMAGLARWAGLGARELGLVRSTWPAGLRIGGVCVAVAAVGFGGALLIPAVRALVQGPHGSWPQAVAVALVLIPLGTVLPEELAFRGVLWALLCRDRGRWLPTLVSSAVFGLWHVLPALGGGSANRAIDAVAGNGALGVLLRVGGTVAFTGAAGVLLCELRIRSDSLLAPMLAHWAVNGMGVLFVQMA